MSSSVRSKMFKSPKSLMVGLGVLTLMSAIGIGAARYLTSAPQDIRGEALVSPPITPTFSPTPSPSPTPSASPYTTPYPGTCPYKTDFNNDGSTDIDDYYIFVSNLNRSGSLVPGDVDCNGIVETADYTYISGKLSPF